MTVENQCDGCRAQIPATLTVLPISGKAVLMHYRNGYPYMACTRERYEKALLGKMGG